MRGSFRRWLSPRRRIVEDPASAWTGARINDDRFARRVGFRADVVDVALAPHVDPSAPTVPQFGCCDVTTGLGLATRHRCKRVIGVDIDPGFDCLARMARRRIGLPRLPGPPSLHRIRLKESWAPFGPVDTIDSWPVFEHIDRPMRGDVVVDFHAADPPGGRCSVRIDPPYDAPVGSRLGHFAATTWARLRASEPALEASIMPPRKGVVPAEQITEQFRSMPFDEYTRFAFRHSQELNRITAGELLDLFLRNGFDPARRNGGGPPSRSPASCSDATMRTCPRPARSSGCCSPQTAKAVVRANEPAQPPGPPAGRAGRSSNRPQFTPAGTH